MLGEGATNVRIGNVSPGDRHSFIGDRQQWIAGAYCVAVGNCDGIDDTGAWRHLNSYYARAAVRVAGGGCFASIGLELPRKNAMATTAANRAAVKTESESGGRIGAPDHMRPWRDCIASRRNNGRATFSGDPIMDGWWQAVRVLPCHWQRRSQDPARVHRWCANIRGNPRLPERWCRRAVRTDPAKAPSNSRVCASPRVMSRERMVRGAVSTRAQARPSCARNR